jgi:hypothetical protein
MRRIMRRTILLFTLMAAALLVGSGVALAQPAPGEVPDASCQPTSGEIVTGKAFLRNSWVMAYTFTAEQTGLLTSAQVQIENAANEPTSTSLVMEIRAVDSLGIPTGEVLATTTIPESGIPPHGQSGVVTGHFSPGAPVEAGQQYAIALHTTTEPVGDGLGWVGTFFLASCPGTLYFNPPPTPGEFIVVAENFDVIFSTFVTLRTAPQTKADCKRGGYKEFGFKNEGQCIKAVKQAG